MKKIPDFSNCIDPEFAKAWYEYNQQLLKDARNNPFIKALTSKDIADAWKDVKGLKK